LKQDQEQRRDGDARFEVAFEQAAVGLAIVAPDGRWQRVNRRLCEIVGYSRAELLARTFQDITHPDDLVAAQERIRRLLAREIGTYTVEKRYIRKDGTVVWTNITVALIHDAQGRPDYFVVAVEDIAARKESEETLRKFSRAIEQSASTVLVTDDRGVIEYVNPRFVETSGYPAQEAIGQRPSMLKSGHTSQEEYAQLWRTISGGDTWRGEFHNRRKDGSLYWESAIISPVRDEQGRITHFVGIKDDITARRKIAADLQSSQERLQLLFEHAPVALAMFDRGMRYLAASRRWMEDYRLGDQAVFGRTYYDLFPEIPARWSDAHRRGLAGEVVRAEVDRFERPDGSEQWLRWEVRPWYLADGAVGGIVIFTEDITDRKRHELILAEHEARYRAVVETTADGFWMLDREGHILTVNEAYVRRSGYSREELLSMWVADLDAQETLEEVRAHIERIRSTGSGLFESLHRAKHGELWPVEVSASYIDIGGGLFFAFSRDISGRKALERQIIDVSTAEQERIGREIHDGVGQQLTGIALLAGSVEQRLRASGHSDDAAAVAELKVHLQDALGEVRALARGLSPVEIDPEGLADALAELAERTTHTAGIRCVYLGTGKVRVHDSASALHLYRLAQEAVQNAIRHSRGRCVEITLERNDRRLVLTVRDDGKGLNIAPERGTGGMGLHIMRYRAGILGGKCIIRSREEGGTEVRCEVPLAAVRAGS
jgi:PAS domain S-box-containing protein